jgi:hypothetical protein
LIAQVKNYWYETEDKAEDAWHNVKDWIFDRSVAKQVPWIERLPANFQPAGPTLNSKHSLTSMESPYLNPERGIHFSKRFAPIMSPLRRKLVR